MEQIVKSVSELSLLAQAAEEGSELSQACCKMIRVLQKDNPTDISRKEAMENLASEIADVILCCSVLERKYGLDSVVDKVYSFKAKRWKKRLESAPRSIDRYHCL